MKYSVINEYRLTLVVVDPEDIEKTMEYYPRTLAEGVLLDLDKTQNITSHLKDDIHLRPEDREAIGKLQGEAGSLVKLNKYGYIPLEFFDKRTWVLAFEFENVADMLANSTYDPEYDFGHIVLVKDNRDAPDTIPANDAYWAIYRFLGKDVSKFENWQKIFTQTDVDRVIKWDDLSEEIKLAAEQIEALVEHAHTHPNRKVLDRFDEDDKGLVTYDDVNPMFRKDFHAILIKDNLDESVLPGDVVMHVTEKRIHQDEQTPDPEDVTIYTLVGNCNEYFANRTDLVDCPVIRSTKATSLNGLFVGCSNMGTLTWFDTVNVESANDFLNGCTSIRYIPTFDWSNLTKGSYLFSNCTNLTIVQDLTFPKLQDGSYMFNGCEKVNHLEDINAPELLYANGMFYGCKSLSTNPKVNSTKLVDTSSMFTNCNNMINFVDQNTKNVKKFNRMFYGCTALRRVENLDFSSAEEASYMFEGCKLLEYVSFVKNTVSISISLQGTNITTEVAKEIIDSLKDISDKGKTETLDLRNTIPAEELTVDDVTIANNKSWIILLK